MHTMQPTTTTGPRFSLGRISATPGALEAMSDAGQDAMHFLRRHISGDWGDLDEEDKRANEFDLTHRGRLLSAYHTSAGVKLWIITEADRSYTTLLLPSEY